VSSRHAGLGEPASAWIKENAGPVDAPIGMNDALNAQPERSTGTLSPKPPSRARVAGWLLAVEAMILLCVAAFELATAKWFADQMPGAPVWAEWGSSIEAAFLLVGVSALAAIGLIRSARKTRIGALTMAASGVAVFANLLMVVGGISASFGAESPAEAAFLIGACGATLIPTWAVIRTFLPLGKRPRPHDGA